MKKSKFNRIYFIVKNGYCKTKKYYKIKYIDARLYINKDGHLKLVFMVFSVTFFPERKAV